MSNALDIRQFSRREFLRLSGTTLVALLALSQPSLAYADSIQSQDQFQQFGRITKNKIKMYDRPGAENNLLRTMQMDEVLPITKSALAQSEPAGNQVWYELDGEGYVHSGSVQPVENKLNTLVQAIPATGLLAEVSVPFTDPLWDVERPQTTANRLYYGTTHWVLGSKQDSLGNWWYLVLEDFYQKQYYVNSAHLRVIPLDETDTLSPSVPAEEKRIEVRLSDQLVIAYEAEKQVQLFRCSAGVTRGYASLTPTGDFRTDYKRPSRHMIDGNDHQMNTYNLPGVPWISYLDENGISFHGTYWHNNFGVPMSHGCINLPTTAAKWIYRWTLPNVPYFEQRAYKQYSGTRVTIK